jgi:hypothetical protein
MRFIGSNLTLKKLKIRVFCFEIKANKASNFIINEVLSFRWCKNYTIGNFTNMKPIYGNVPGVITVIHTFYNDEKKYFLRVFTF